MGRAPCCDKANVKKGPWSPEEDAKLKSYIEKHGTGGNWIALPQKIGLKRCGKSCRLRWLNYLRPNIKHGGFSEEEDNIICSLYISIGSRWSIIAAQLPGRTDNDIKNYWNTKLKKKLLGKTRKEGRQSAAAGRRGGGVAEQEPNKPANQQQPYWAPVLPTPIMLPGSPATPMLDDHGSVLRKLIPELNGGLNQVPFDHDHPQPMFNISSMDLAPNSITGDVCSSMVAPTQVVDGISWSFPNEFEDMLYYNSMKLEGIDGLCDMGNPIGCCGSIGASENVVGPVVFTPQVTGEYYQRVALHHGELGEQMQLLGGTQ